MNGGADVIIVGKCPHLPTSHIHTTVQSAITSAVYVQVSAWVDHMGSVGEVPAQLPQQQLQLRQSHKQAFLWWIVRINFSCFPAHGELGTCRQCLPRLLQSKGSSRHMLLTWNLNMVAHVPALPPADHSRWEPPPP